MESNYGLYMGNKNVICFLVIFVYEGCCLEFVYVQLFVVLKIFQYGDVLVFFMIGFWVGVMGQIQFILIIYNQYVVDFDGDGKCDIWGLFGDVLVFIVNYLKVFGWIVG